MEVKGRGEERRDEGRGKGEEGDGGRDDVAGGTHLTFGVTNLAQTDIVIDRVSSLAHQIIWLFG